MKSSTENLRVQRIIALLSLFLFLVKLYAWYITRSVSILTDASESVVNILAGFFGWYSIYISSKPRDSDHPYGHGKIEFISAAVEGTFIVLAGLFIIYEAVMHLRYPRVLDKLAIGIPLIIITGVVTFVAGLWALKKGEKNKSPALLSSGRHLITDTYSTGGIVVGLVLYYITDIWWIDSVVGILFAFFIVHTGIKIIRSSVGGIMDEADETLLENLVATLNKRRRVNWIDLHNVRIIKYGAVLHIDCHLTVPWYFNVREAHNEIDELSLLVKEEYGDLVELFVHSDDCQPFSCQICHKADCAVRQHPYEKTIVWTVENVRLNKRHGS